MSYIMSEIILPFTKPAFSALVYQISLNNEYYDTTASWLKVGTLS